MGAHHMKRKRPSSQGFLHEFSESTIELPADSRNGDCIVHFSGEFSKYVMKVPLVNGERDGTAIILNGSVPSLRLECHNGGLNGTVEKLNESGSVVLRGHLANGVETGLFREYSNSVMIWMGYYRNGERYSTVMESELFRGFYTEQLVEDGKLLSIAQYDETLHDKNGYCIECVNGEMVECVFANGLKKPLIRECGNGIKSGESCSTKKRDRPTEEVDVSSKRMCMSLVHDPLAESFMQYDIQNQFEYGVWKSSSICRAVKRSLYENSVIEVDLHTHGMKVYKNNQLVETMEPCVDCIDVNAEGKRWEGSVRNGLPCGYGILYGEQGRKRYEGFMMDGMKCCYGKEYYDDIEVVEYEGCFFDNERFGYGICYDRNGGILRKGSDPARMSSQSNCDGTIINSFTESLEIRGSSYKTVKSLILSPFHHLKRIVIGDNCFGCVRSFVLNGLGELESVVIGRESFTYVKELIELQNLVEDSDGDGTSDESDGDSNEDDSNDNDSYDNDSITSANQLLPYRVDGEFRILNCPKLKSIQIECSSFSDYNCFEVNNLPSLGSLQMGSDCFFSASSFSLAGTVIGYSISVDLPQLQSFKLGNNEFYQCQSVTFDSNQLP